ncbi:MAG: SCP2 sterol-binding domain-containing protein [Bacillota bacterium]|nr:SCP2 sterol-binding domain-containing protein [Bacillota bacterium]
MATAEELREALEDFVARYQEEPRLKVMNRDWDRVLHVVPTDLPEGRFTLRVKEGDVLLEDGASGEADMVLRAKSDLLTDLFFGDISPTEPYMQGDLRIEASEEDTIRLDVITLMIWGE